MTGDSLLRVTGLAGAIGALAVAATNAVATVVVDHQGWMQDTISDLAAGPSDWIQDIGLYLFAAGLVALSIGLWRLDLNGWRWTGAAVLLWVLAADVVVMAAFEAYSGGDPGFTLHPWAVYLFGFAFGLVLLFLAPGLGHVGRGWMWASLAVFVAWVVLAPIYFVVPPGIEGAYERGLGLIVIAWMLAISLLLHEEGRAAR